MHAIKAHKIFLLDGIGAGISILLLFLVYTFEAIFGMPGNVVAVFIGIAAICFVYSITNYILKPINWKFYLKLIATLNLSYCLFTGYHVLQHSSSLTLFGYIYFVGEILILIALSLFEFYNARQQQ